MPSDADIAFTRKLAQALDLVDVLLLDHFIVTASQAIGFTELGLMPFEVD